METRRLAPLLILISAPSGGGKTTLCGQLLKARPEMTRAITCTTRAPRPGERDGVDYHFFSAAEFLKRLQAGNFLEHATVYGNSYGILKSELLTKLREGKDVLLNLDVQGAATLARAGGKRAGIATGTGDRISHPEFPQSARATVAKTRGGRRGGDPKTPGGGQAGGRPVEKF